MNLVLIVILLLEHKHLKHFTLTIFIERHMSCEENYTDDVNLAFLDKKKIDIVSGSEYNFKITTPEDIKIAEKLFLNV